MSLATVLQLKKYVTIACVVLFVLLVAAIGCSHSQRASSSFSPTGDFGDIEWPESALAQMLPEPETKYGDIVADSAELLVVNIGNTEKGAYDAYVKACMEKGFTVGYSRSSTFFTAQDAAGYNLSLWYNENDQYMNINLDAWSNESESIAASAGSSGDASGQDDVGDYAPVIDEAVEVEEESIQFSKDALADKIIKAYNERFPASMVTLERVSGRPTAAYYQTDIDFGDGIVLEIGYGDGSPYYSLHTNSAGREVILQKARDVFPIILEDTNATVLANEINALEQGAKHSDYFEDGYSEMYMALNQDTIDGYAFELSLYEKTW